MDIAVLVLKGCAEEAEERQPSKNCKAERKHRVETGRRSIHLVSSSSGFYLEFNLGK